ncbi:DNA-binding response regulator [Dokdonia pacifica]|uniref:Two component transcriptional regulator, LytTR family n=1 Tax=Dokdonia pacifica TaxID=1627892 RepID=A0A239DCM0_9FLAO|nr:LytTR family DNA-binding domain-containing protein [Dokdonia pacifica]GGG40096.1 DNA-binding response regulator [Dokdonia pacifica]SNS29614.1 two component transcriptional regulator, LytTR family [Dokdonia pacifica]
MIKCIVIDDEPLARECITNYIQEIDFLSCMGSFSTVLEMNSSLNIEDIDVLFLDIQMPVINGLDFLKMTKNPPITILTTAFPNYAIEGFELNVLDYLLKPISFNRFFAAVSKAKTQYVLKQSIEDTETLQEEQDCFFIKCDGKYEKIHVNAILFVQAMQNYVIIQTTERRYITLLFLKNVIEKLDKNAFIRVHKSYVVAISKIDTIESHEIHVKDFKIPLSRNYKKEVMPIIIGNKLWNDAK